MEDLDALDELVRLLAAPDDPVGGTADGAANGAAVHLPASLLVAADLAVTRFAVARSPEALVADALRRSLETLAMDAALRLHYEQHPHARTSLADVALALAAQERSPLADRPDLVADAAAAVTARHRDAGAADVLLWAEARLAADG